MKKTIFPIIIALSALSVSASAAFYSVFGLSKLFAGASTQVIIMAGALEIAKLVVASLLYQYWGVINKILRTYLLIATFVLMVITSGGIYGYLSGAYKTTATQSEFLDKQVLIIDAKRTRFEEQKTDLIQEKEQLVKSISDLRKSLSNPTQVSYYSEEAQQVITTTSSSTRQALQNELKTTIDERDAISLKIEAITDSIAKLDVSILNAQIDNEAARELGPLKYMAEITGQSMSKIVNWFMLLIVFVFDPLAIAMVVAANMAFAQIRPKRIELEEESKDYKVYKKDLIDPIKEDDIVVTQEIEEKIKLENNLDDEGEIIEDFLEDTTKEDLTYPEFTKKHYSKEQLESEEEIWIPERDSLSLEEIEKEAKEVEGGLLQDNLVKDLPEEEQPKEEQPNVDPPNNSWGSPGGRAR